MSKGKHPAAHMGDEGEYWKDVREFMDAESKKRRAFNRASSAALLSANGVSFVSSNGGVHLVVESAIDFWPGTGLWISRLQPKRGRGVHSLIRFIKSRE